ncbi:hypothetical protein FLLO111716_01735 [Flavobacterium longum]
MSCVLPYLKRVDVWLLVMTELLLLLMVKLLMSKPVLLLKLGLREPPSVTMEELKKLSVALPECESVTHAVLAAFRIWK